MTDNETACVACCLLSPAALVRVTARLEVEDFTDPTCRLVYRAILYCQRRGQVVSRPAILKAARANGHELSVDTLAGLTKDFPVISDVDGYVEAVAEASVRRTVGPLLVAALAKVADDSRSAPLATTLQTLGQALADKARALSPEPSAETTRAAVDRLIRERDTPGTGPEWGMEALRRELPRPRRGQFVVFAANTSVGKSTIMAQEALAQARAGRAVLWIGLEMDRDEVINMLCRLETGFGPMDRAHWPTSAPPGAAEAWAATFEPLDFRIRDDLHVLADIDAAVRAAAMSARPPDIVYVDYVQRVRVPGTANDFQRASAVSMGLKSLAAQVRIPLVTASQFSRAVPPGDEPGLHHLKDSSSIEQDANAVILLWRPDREAVSKVQHEVYARLAKVRGGPAGERFVLTWLPRVGCLADEAMLAERAGWNGSRADDWAERIAGLRIPG